MDILLSLGLIVGILLALNFMAGGRHSTILRPAIRIAENLLTVAIRIITTVLGSVFKLGAGSVKLPKSMDSREHKPPGPPPPRWKDK
jgi:hypothetical protein